MRKLGWILLAVAAGPVAAHPGHPEAGAFVAGLVHPFAGWDHLLAALAVGVLAAAAGRRLLPLAFVAATAIGIAGGASEVAADSVETLLALSVLVLGACAAVPKTALFALPVVAFGLAHGYAHGNELSGAAPFGAIVATAALHLAGYALGRASRRPRTLGAGIALLGAGCWILA